MCYICDFVEQFAEPPPAVLVTTENGERGVYALFEGFNQIEALHIEGLQLVVGLDEQRNTCFADLRLPDGETPHVFHATVLYDGAHQAREGSADVH